MCNMSINTFTINMYAYYTCVDKKCTFLYIHILMQMYNLNVIYMHVY